MHNPPEAFLRKNLQPWRPEVVVRLKVGVSWDELSWLGCSGWLWWWWCAAASPV